MATAAAAAAANNSVYTSVHQSLDKMHKNWLAVIWAKLEMLVENKLVQKSGFQQCSR